MSRLPLLLALLTVAPPLQATDFYRGCGATFGTCASASVTAVRQANGSYIVSVTIQNRSYLHSKGSARNGMLWSAYVPTPTNQAQPLTVTGPGGIDLSHYMGGGGSGITGFVERSDPTGEPVWGAFTGSEDPHCAADPRCAARNLQSGVEPVTGDTVVYQYIPGAITFTFSTASWSNVHAVRVSQNLIGGNGYEQYDLVVTPEPVSLVLLATGLAGVGAARRRRKP